MGSSTTPASSTTVAGSWRYYRTRRSGADLDDIDALAAAQERRWDLVGQVRAPVLLVRGGDSPVVDDDDVAELRRRLPAAEVAVVAGAGHSVQGDRPVELAALIERFAFA